MRIRIANAGLLFLVAIIVIASVTRGTLVTLQQRSERAKIDNAAYQVPIDDMGKQPGDPQPDPSRSPLLIIQTME